MSVSVYDHHYDAAQEAKRRAEEYLEAGDLTKAEHCISELSSHAHEFLAAGETIEEWETELSNRLFDMEIMEEGKG